MRTGSVKTAHAEVVVLRAINYGERDKILTLYTREFGKVRAIAKGVRRTTSRMGGHLDLCGYAAVLLVHGRNLEIVTQGRALRTFPRLRDDLTAFSKACYAVELIDRFTEDGDPNPELFRSLVRVLEHIETNAQPTQALCLFMLQLLALSGYRPQLYHCVACEAAIAPGDNAFDAALGGVLCPACAPAHQAARPIGVAVLKFLRNLQRRGEDLLRMPVSPEALAEAEAFLDLYVHHLLERRPHSASFRDILRRDESAASSAEHAEHARPA